MAKKQAQQTGAKAVYEKLARDKERSQKKKSEKKLAKKQ